jgi:hypothetical protein
MQLPVLLLQAPCPLLLLLLLLLLLHAAACACGVLWMIGRLMLLLLSPGQPAGDKHSSTQEATAAAAAAASVGVSCMTISFTFRVLGT